MDPDSSAEFNFHPYCSKLGPSVVEVDTTASITICFEDIFVELMEDNVLAYLYNSFG